jgi:hypothetical protein
MNQFDGLVKFHLFNLLQRIFSTGKREDVDMVKPRTSKSDLAICHQLTGIPVARST